MSIVEYAIVDGIRYGKVKLASSGSGTGDGRWITDPDKYRTYRTGKATAYDLYDTGGYTGEWINGDKNGRFAMLHQKELVLNKADTSNMLAAVRTIRELDPEMIASIRSRLSGAAFASKALMGSRFGALTNFVQNEGASGLVQNVNINADFPGVRDAIEIKEALESLVQTSAQRINFYTK